MLRSIQQLVGVAMLVVGVLPLLAQRDAALRGVVRDADGTPQMGVAVQVWTGDARVAASAFTDLNGRYFIRDLAPGVYQLRATAALYLPAIRSKLQLRAGEMPTVNVVLSGLLSSTLLPVTRRHSDEQPDDWRWALRSSASRPLLRVLADDAATARGEGPAARPQVRRTVSVGEVYDGFGAGRGAISAEESRAGTGDHAALVAARLGITQPMGNSATGTDASALYERQSTPTIVRRASIHAETLPQIAVSGRSPGLTVIDTAVAEQLMVGEFARVEAGSMLRALRSGQTALTAYPFVRMEIVAPAGWIAGYAMATSAQLQRMSDVGLGADGVPAARIVAGHLQPERGVHQAIYVRRQVGKATIKAALERDALRTVTITGVSGAPGGAAMVDASNGMFRELYDGFHSSGVDLLLSYQMSAAVRVDAGYLSGAGLAARSAPAAVGRTLLRQESQAVRMGTDATVRRTGTRIVARYAWQPKSIATSISPFSDGDGSYLSLHLRQRLHVGHLLPASTELCVDGANLAAQGYMVLASAETTPPAVIASTARSLQASLNFTF